MESGRISDEQLNASSSFVESSTGARNGRYRVYTSNSGSLMIENFNVDFTLIHYFVFVLLFVLLCIICLFTQKQSGQIRCLVNHFVHPISENSWVEWSLSIHSWAFGEKRLFVWMNFWGIQRVSTWDFRTLSAFSDCHIPHSFWKEKSLIC